MRVKIEFLRTSCPATSCAAPLVEHGSKLGELSASELGAYRSTLDRCIAQCRCGGVEAMGERERLETTGSDDLINKPAQTPSPATQN